MKTLLAALFAVLLAFSAAMVATKPRPGTPGKTLLTWVTDKNPTRDEQTALFRRLHPGLEVQIDPGNTDTQKVIVQSQAGVGPDLFDYWGEANRDAYVKGGIAWDLTDGLRARGVDVFRDLWPLALPWTTKDGRVYGVPANVSLDGFWLHRDMFEKAGAPLPKKGWTLDDLVETAKRLTVRDNKGHVTQYGLLIDFGGGYRELLPGFGGDLFDAKGLRCTVAERPSVECLGFMRDLLYKHRVAPSPADEQSLTAGGGWGGGAAGPQAYFRKRMGAMALGGRWWLVQLRDDIRERGFRLAAVEPPVNRFPGLGGGGTRALMVNARSPHREEALEFIVYLMGKDYNLLLNDQGDALSGVRRYAYTSRYLHPLGHEDEDFHAPWRATLERGVMLRSSSFITGSEVDTYLNRQLDLVKLNQKEPEPALRDAARDIDAAIRRNASRDPRLREAYLAAGGTL